jgi:type III restriction enzyme
VLANNVFFQRLLISISDLSVSALWDASRIEEDEKAIVVFFKMNLSTGWDCPRAETMMSFRHANDYTYIAQLLGRMIRTPLARRVESDAELNNVGLFLPFFDEKTVKMVEQVLRDSEAIVPAETGSHKELITLKRDPAFADVFSDMNLITYHIDSARKQPALRRLIALARALTQDMIAPEARKRTKKVLWHGSATLTVKGGRWKFHMKWME